MDELLYIVPFFLALGASLVLCFGIITFFKRIRIPNVRTDVRHLHVAPIPRFGGVAIVVSFLVALVLNPHLFFSVAILAVLGGLLIVFIGALIDDIWELDWKIQLFFQVLAVSVAFFFGAFPAYVSNPWSGGLLHFDTALRTALGLVAIGGWVIVLMNTINWIDGADGIGGGVSIIGALTLFFLSLKPEVNQPPVAIMTIAFVGAVAGFLFVNFHPAKIFAGTSGAMSMGYILAMLSIFAGGKIATTLLVMAIPVVDALWVIMRRLKKGRSIFEPDREHLHHSMLAAGFSQWQVCLAYYAFTALVAVLALRVGPLGKIVIFSVALGCISLAIFLIRNKSIKKIW